MGASQLVGLFCLALALFGGVALVVNLLHQWAQRKVDEGDERFASYETGYWQRRLEDEYPEVMRKPATQAIEAGADAEIASLATALLLGVLTERRTNRAAIKPAPIPEIVRQYARSENPEHARSVELVLQGFEEGDRKILIKELTQS